MTDLVTELALEHSLADADMLEARSRVLKALYTQFEQIDSGIGEGVADFWVRHGDVEYKLEMKPCRSFKAPQ